MSRNSQSSKRSFVVCIDEEGFTDKKCRKCRNRLSVEEVQVFAPMVKDLELLCLNCYASIVEERSRKRRSSAGRNEGKVVVDGPVDALTEKSHSRSNRNSSLKETRQSLRNKVPERVFNDFQHNRKKTDVTLFANASFNGGVFLNAVPGQSI